MSKTSIFQLYPWLYLKQQSIQDTNGYYMRDNYVCNSISDDSSKYSPGLSIILLSPLEWILTDRLEEGEIDTFDKQGNMEERRETGEFSRRTNRSEISGHLPAENRTGTTLHCNANMLEIQTGFSSFPNCCSLKYWNMWGVPPWNEFKDP